MNASLLWSRHVLASCVAVAALAWSTIAGAQLPAATAQPAGLPAPAKATASPAGRPAPAKPAVPTKPGDAAKPAKPKQDPKQREEARAKLLQRIRTLRAQELAEVLKPDAAAVTKVVEIAGGFEDRLIATRQELRGHRGELDKLLKVTPPNDAAIQKITDEMLAKRKKLDDIEAERTAALRKALTPSQFAKVVVAWPRINRHIQEQLYRALLKSKPGQGLPDEY